MPHLHFTSDYMEGAHPSNSKRAYGKQSGENRGLRL